MRAFIAFVKDEVDAINATLSEADSEQLSDKQRDRLIDIKRFYVRAIEWFGNVVTDAKTLEQSFEQNL